MSFHKQRTFFTLFSEVLRKLLLFTWPSFSKVGKAIISDDLYYLRKNGSSYKKKSVWTQALLHRKHLFYCTIFKQYVSYILYKLYRFTQIIKISSAGNALEGIITFSCCYFTGILYLSLMYLFYIMKVFWNSEV